MSNNFDPQNVLLAIATNATFVLQGHILPCFSVLILTAHCSAHFASLSVCVNQREA